jgi:hypothetical protein
VKNESSCAQAGEATCTVRTPLRIRPASVREAMRVPTTFCQVTRSSTTPPARALASLAPSKRTPSGDGERGRPDATIYGSGSELRIDDELTFATLEETDDLACRGETGVDVGLLGLRAHLGGRQVDALVEFFLES